MKQNEPLIKFDFYLPIEIQRFVQKTSGTEEKIIEF